MEEEEHSVNFKIPHQVGDEHDTAGSICLTIAALLSILLSAEDHQRSEQNQNAAKKKMKPKDKEQLPSSTHGTTRIQRCFNFQVEQEHSAVKMKQHDLPLYTEPVFFL